MDALKERLVAYIMNERVTPLMILGATVKYLQQQPDQRLVEIGDKIDKFIVGVRAEDLKREKSHGR